MKKSFLKLTVMLGMILVFTACGRNAGTEAAGNVEEQIENQTEAQIEDGAERQTYIWEENETDIQEESAEDLLNNNGSAVNDDQSENEEETGERTEMKMNVQIGDYTFTATLEDNKAVKELVDMMKDGPITITMDDYSGFEKVGPLGRSLTRSDVPTTTTAGDIVLYNGNQIVIFYGSNSWDYTRIGRIDDLTGWKDALGSGSVTVTFDIA